LGFAAFAIGGVQDGQYAARIERCVRY
jgi:hypothetical protein